MTRSTRHHYSVALRWIGNTGEGTSSYRGYSRNFTVDAAGRPSIPGSADATFLGDAAHWNPEELFVASLSACHQLWYLHFCADSGVVVERYEDRAEGEMRENSDGSGEFVRVVLHPRVTVSVDSDVDTAMSLHERAHAFCFIARSVNFPVEHVASVNAAGTGNRR